MLAMLLALRDRRKIITRIKLLTIHHYLIVCPVKNDLLVVIIF